MASSKGKGGALPPVVASERVAAIVADGSPALSPPRLPAAMTSARASSSSGAGALGSARDGVPRVDSSAFTAPGGRLRIGPDGVPLKFSVLAQRAAAAPGARAASLAATAAAGAAAAASGAGGPAATAVLAGATQRAAAGAAARGAQVDAVLAHQLQLLVALVGPKEAAALELADLFARRAQPTLLAEAAATLLGPAEDVEARHGLSFLEL